MADKQCLLHRLVGGLRSKIQLHPTITSALIAAIVALTVTIVTLHFEEKTRYDKVAQQIELWKLEGYRELARCMPRIPVAAYQNDRVSFQNAVIDYDAATRDLLLVTREAHVLQRKRIFESALRRTNKWMRTNEGPLRMDLYQDLCGQSFQCVNAMRKEFQLDPLAEYQEPLSLME